MYGVTKALARFWGYDKEMKDLSLSLAKQIYKELFWDKLKCEAMPQDLACKLFDMAVNLGVRRASKIFQRNLNDINKVYMPIKVDGKIGKSTMLLCNKLLNHRNNQKALITAMNVEQGYWYLTLQRKFRKNKSFIVGWLINRIDF